MLPLLESINRKKKSFCFWRVCSFNQLTARQFQMFRHAAGAIFKIWCMNNVPIPSLLTWSGTCKLSEAHEAWSREEKKRKAFICHIYKSSSKSFCTYFKYKKKKEYICMYIYICTYIYKSAETLKHSELRVSFIFFSSQFCTD